MSIRTVNLNLLPILDALLKERSVSRAAARLGLSQPATSTALSKLRELLKDPLLVPAGRNLELTARALEIAPLAHELCVGVERLIAATSFDAAETNRTFIIAAPDYLAYLLGEVLVPIVRQAAPHVRLFFTDVPGSLPERLAAGDVDLAICADLKSWPNLERSEAFFDQIVPLARSQHPLFELADVSSSDMQKYPQFAFFRGIDAKMKFKVGDRGKNGPHLATQQFLVLPFLAATSDGIAWAPRSLAVRWKSLLPLKIIEAGHIDFETRIFWSPSKAGDLAQAWLRTMLLNALVTSHERAGKADCASPATGQSGPSP